MAPDIGYFPIIELNGANITNLQRITRSDELSGDVVPSTRHEFYIGVHNGTRVVIKPFQNCLEAKVSERLVDKPLSGLLDFNDRYLIEMVLEFPHPEEQYQRGKLTGEQIGYSIGKFFDRLHGEEIIYNDDLMTHLFLMEDNTIRGTDFGSAFLSICPRDIVRDLMGAFEYLKDSINWDNGVELVDAIDTFCLAYSERQYPKLLLLAKGEYVKHASESNPLKELLG
jgi:hypothetical protein